MVHILCTPILQVKSCSIRNTLEIKGSIRNTLQIKSCSISNIKEFFKRHFRAIVDSTFAKNGRAAAGEQYIPQESWDIFVVFFSIVPIHLYSFLILLSLQQTHTNVLQKSACQNVQYLSFYRTLKIAKIGSRMSFFLLSPHISGPPIFKHFLVELKC